MEFTIEIDTIPGFADEGFVAAHRLGSRAEVDSVVLRRAAIAWPTLSQAAREGRHS